MYRLITQEQVKNLLTYGYEHGRVWKEPSDGEIMQGFGSLKPLDIEAVKRVCKTFVSIIDDCPDEVKAEWMVSEYEDSQAILKQLEGV